MILSDRTLQLWQVIIAAICLCFTANTVKTGGIWHRGCNVNRELQFHMKSRSKCLDTLPYSKMNQEVSSVVFVTLKWMNYIRAVSKNQWCKSNWTFLWQVADGGDVCVCGGWFTTLNCNKTFNTATPLHMFLHIRIGEPLYIWNVGNNFGIRFDGKISQQLIKC